MIKISRISFMTLVFVIFPFFIGKIYYRRLFFLNLRRSISKVLIYDFVLSINESDRLQFHLYETITPFLNGETLSLTSKPLCVRKNWPQCVQRHNKMYRIEFNLISSDYDKTCWNSKQIVRNYEIRLFTSNLTK